VNAKLCFPPRRHRRRRRRDHHHPTIITITIISLELLRQALKLYFNNVRLQLNFYAIDHTLNSMGWSGLDWIHLVHDSDKWRAVVNKVMKLSEFRTMQETVSLPVRGTAEYYLLLCVS
jgi:hypothetical protein